LGPSGRWWKPGHPRKCGDFIRKRKRTREIFFKTLEIDNHIQPTLAQKLGLEDAQWGPELSKKNEEKAKGIRGCGVSKNSSNASPTVLSHNPLKVEAKTGFVGGR